MTTKGEPTFGEALLESLEEVRAWKRGEHELEVIEVDPMPKERIQQIRKKVARTVRDFEARFGIPAATMNNWEQGRRKPGPSDRLLLKLIEAEPATVEKVAKSAA